MTSRVKATVRIVVALAVVGAVVWWLHARSSEAADPRPAASGAERTVPVQLATAETQDVAIWLEGLGTVSAVQQVTVRTQVDGRLDQVLFTEGQTVRAGEVLAQVDPRPFLVQLHQAEGALARDSAQKTNAKKTFERNQNLHDQQLIAQQTVDDSAAQVGQADGAIAIDHAAVENARLQLDYAQIKSPIDGTTGVRQVDAGNLVHPTDASGIVVVTQLDPAAVYFSVAEDQLPAVARAMARGKVPVEAWSRDGLELLGVGTAAVIDNQINASTATMRLKALVPNPLHELWPNQFVKARLLLDVQRGALVVPTVAIQRGTQGDLVYVVGPGDVAQPRPVTIAGASGELTIIARGLAPGDRVVVEGQSQLHPGAKVAVQEGIAPAGRAGRGTKKSGP